MTKRTKSMFLKSLDTVPFDPFHLFLNANSFAEVGITGKYGTRYAHLHLLDYALALER